MNTPVHQFKDEWLVQLIEREVALPPGRVDQWRSQQAPFISQQLLDTGILTFTQLAEIILRAFRIPSTDLGSGVPPEAARLLPEKVSRQHFVLAVQAGPKSVDLAMANPLDEAALQDVRWVTGRGVNPLFCPPATLERAALEELAPDAIVYNLLRKFETSTPVEVVERESAEPVVEATDGPRAPVIQLADNIIGNAVLKNASDVHIEHDEASTLVRFRIDGLLRHVLTLPRYVGAGPLVARIKIMAGLDVSDRLRPQDGRAKLRVGGNLIGLRVSTLPSRTGEKVVLRILNERAIQATLPQLGFHPDVMARFSAILALEQGMLLVTGPTGSGKTTTLYAALNHLHGETVNVVTVEDPIEYRLSGITQVQVNEKQGLTFAAVLRSVLRQDPDIVMVGEIRDKETAVTAVQAALTGHLVLSTLHTNDTVGAVTRLVDMGVEGFKLASGLAGVTAQRLVRRVCPACAEPADPGTLPAEVRAAMGRLFGRVAHVRAPGCPQCGFVGLKGRIPVIELLEIGSDLREAIARGDSEDQLRRRAAETGALHSLETDALWHLLEGRTTLQEVQPYLAGAALKSPATVAPAAAARPAATVPAVPALEAAAREGVGAAPSAERPRVLVAVADPVWHAVLEGALASCDVEAEWVDNGAAALANVAGRTPALLIVAADLPGLSGEQVVRGVRTVIQATAVGTIALLGAEDGAARARLTAAGADEVLAPPIDAAGVRARVSATLARGRMWSPAAEVMRPPTPVREAQRIAALRATGLLDTPAEERFDRITLEARESFGVPMSVISLVDADRQWFKSRQGVAAEQTAREIAFCGHAINYDGVFEVEDACLDARFWDNPLVTGDPGIRFYAGCPITTRDGSKIGMMCVMDHKPHRLRPEERLRLQELARKVESEIAQSRTAA